jgi:hypothetical protein
VTQAVQEDRIAALQEEIRSAGRQTHTTRWWVALGFATLAAVVAAWAAVHGGEFSAIMVPVAFVSFLFGSGCAVIIAFSAAGLYRARRTGQLRSLLAALPPSQQMGALAPLQEDSSGDVRKIVAPLLREFGLPSEVTPARPPAGRGDEPASAER